LANVIGNIWPGEAYAYLGTEGSSVNQWRINPTSVKIPVYDDYDVASNSFQAINFFNAYWRWGAINGSGTIALVDAGTDVVIYGDNFTQLTLRRTEEIYDRYGNYVGTLPGGTKLAIDSGSCGSTKTYLLAFHYYYQNGQWHRAVGDNYGFIDTGAREYGCEGNWSIMHNYNS